MFNTEFNFSHNGKVQPDKVEIGHEGDHNAHTLIFIPDQTIIDNTEYFRVFIDEFSSEPIYLTNNKVEFKVPNGVLKNGVQLIQIKCYNRQNGLVTMVLCSNIITASTNFSLDECIEIPENLKADATTLRNELGELVNLGQDIKETAVNAAEIAKQSEQVVTAAAEVATNCSNIAETARVEVAENTSKVLNALEQTYGFCETSKSASELAVDSASMAAIAKDRAMVAAAAIEDTVRRKEVSNLVKSLYTSGDILVQSEICEILTKFVPNEAEPTIGGYYFNYFSRPILLNPNTTYKVRVEGYLDGTEIGSTLFAFDAESKHVTITPALFEITSIYFDTNYEYTSFEFTTPSTLAENTLAFIGGKFNNENVVNGQYHINITAENTAVVYTKAEVDDKFLNIQLPEVNLENYYTKEETDLMLGDVETALDGIIAIQNALIGGEG